MSDKCFFDTNILVYMQDVSEPEKQQKARALFSTNCDNGTAVISTQCLQEFYNVLAYKLKQDKTIVKKQVKIFSENLPVVNITPAIIENAIDINIRTKFSFWDSLMLSAANYAGCSILYSEDLNDGQIVDGVTIRNPFA